jgi:hypothetical protein
MTFIRQDNEKVILGPEKMITVPPRHYCVVENPVARDGGMLLMVASASFFFFWCLFAATCSVWMFSVKGHNTTLTRFVYTYSTRLSLSLLYACRWRHHPGVVEAGQAAPRRV